MIVTASRRQLLVCSWFALVSTISGAGCGIDRGDPSFVDEDAAFLHCTVAGTGRTDPALFEALPRVPVPSGLYTQTMSPAALVEIGYQPESVVCATLAAPDDAELAKSASSLATLLTVRDEVDDAVRRRDPCACTAAAKLRRQRWLPSCADVGHQPGCEPSDTLIDDVERELGRLDSALGEVTVPLTHWRVFGRSDRLGQFEARVPRIVDHHSGGSAVMLRGAPVPERLNHVLVGRLFELSTVQAVIRQDSGRALVVVREIGDTLVYDHFAYPSVASSMVALLPELDNRSVTAYLDALEPPAQRMDLAFNPRHGPVLVFSHPRLERVDAAMVVGSALSQRRVRAGEHTVPPVWFDTVTVHAPFDASELTAHVVLSDLGVTWAQGLERGPVSPTLSELGGSDVVPTYAAARSDPAFVLRGTPIEQVVFAGFHALPTIAAAMEMAVPNSVRGELDDFVVDVPTGPLPGELATRAGLAQLRERLSLDPQRLRVEIGTTTMDLRLSAR